MKLLFKTLVIPSKTLNRTIQDPDCFSKSQSNWTKLLNCTFQVAANLLEHLELLYQPKAYHNLILLTSKTHLSIMMMVKTPLGICIPQVHHSTSLYTFNRWTGGTCTVGLWASTRYERVHAVPPLVVRPIDSHSSSRVPFFVCRGCYNKAFVCSIIILFSGTVLARHMWSNSVVCFILLLIWISTRIQHGQ